jgi:hypothetical protein
VTRVGLRCDRHLEHAIALIAEELVGLLDLIELEAMGDERPDEGL